MCPSSTHPSPRLGRRQPDRVRVPRPVLLGERQRRDRLAGGDAGQVRLRAPSSGLASSAFAASTALARYGPPYSAGAEFLQHDRLLGEGEAGPAVLLGDRDALQAQLLARLRPDVRVDPVGVSISSRTADSGARSARNRRTDARSSSCSALTPRSSFRLRSFRSIMPTCGPVGDDQHVECLDLAAAHPQRVDLQRPQARPATGPARRCRRWRPPARPGRRPAAARPCSSGRPRSSPSIRRPRPRRPAAPAGWCPAGSRPRPRPGRRPAPGRSRVHGDAGQQLHAAGPHRRDQHLVPARQGLVAGRPDLLVGGADRRVAGQVQRHAADVGLVRDLRRADLQRHRRARAAAAAAAASSADLTSSPGHHRDARRGQQVAGLASDHGAARRPGAGRRGPRQRPDLAAALLPAQRVAERLRRRSSIPPTRWMPCVPSSSRA